MLCTLCFHICCSFWDWDFLGGCIICHGCVVWVGCGHQPGSLHSYHREIFVFTVIKAKMCMQRKLYTWTDLLEWIYLTWTVLIGLKEEVRQVWKCMQRFKSDWFSLKFNYGLTCIRIEVLKYSTHCVHWTLESHSYINGANQGCSIFTMLHHRNNGKTIETELLNWFKSKLISASAQHLFCTWTDFKLNDWMFLFQSHDALQINPTFASAPNTSHLTLSMYKMSQTFTSGPLAT